MKHSLFPIILTRSAGRWSRFSWKTGTYLSIVVNTTAASGVATQTDHGNIGHDTCTDPLT